MSLSFMNRLRAVSVASALTLSCVLPVAAQSAGSGAISGTVTDKAGAVIPGAPVVITDTDTGAVRELKTNGSGFFIAPFLQSGHYEVVIGGGAFAKVDRKGIVITVGDTFGLNTTLPAAAVSTEVVVNGSDEPVLDTAKTSVSQTIDQNIISNLSVNSRRFDSYVLLTPNVVPDGFSGLLAFRGISGLYNSNIVDGTSNNQAFFAEARGRASGAPYVYSVDSIKEFSSSASSYSAEFGGAAGGIVNAITKSGGNKLHGDLFYDIRYPDLNALDPYSKWSALHNNGNKTLLTPTIHQQQQFGGSIGGAIIKDKLFYFFTYDGFRKVNPALYTTSSANLSPTLAAGGANPNYFGNVVTGGCPSVALQPTCAAAIAYFNSNFGAFPRTQKQDIYFPKLDYQLNQKNHISAQFLFDNFIQPNGYSPGNVFTNTSPTTNGKLNYHERIFITNVDSVLTASSANSFRGQWSRDLETAGTNDGGPNFSLSNIFAYGETNALPRPKFPDEHRWEAFDVYTWTHGKHTVKGGVDVSIIHEQIQNLYKGTGDYTYSGASAFTNYIKDITCAAPAVCNNWTGFTQAHDNVNPQALAGSDDFWNKDIAGFAEDSWKVVPKLTVNVGLRYDVQLVPQPPHPYDLSPYPTDSVVSPLGEYYTTTIHINTKMFQPRFGFAWNPQVGTVLRGGYGLYYGLNVNSLYYDARVENGVYQQTFNFTSPAQAPTGFTAPMTLFTPTGPPQAPPFAGAVATSSLYGACTPHCPNPTTPVSFNGIDPKYTNPYTHSFDLTLEQQLPFKTTLTLSYVGTRGMRLPYAYDVNQPHATTLRTYTIYNAAGVVDTTQGKAGTVTVPFTPVNTLRPDVDDGNILVEASGLNSWYHSGVMTFKKNFDHGLEVVMNETWSKVMDESQVSGVNGTFNGTNVILDPFNIKGHYGNGVTMTREYARSDIDVRTRFVGTVVYAPVVHTKLPKAFVKTTKYVNYAANGWQISTTYTAQSGTPLTPQLYANPTGNYAGLDGGATGLADNLSNFPTSAYGRAPFVGRNSSVFAGIHNVDARVGRAFPIHKDINFNIFAEAFNVANHREVQAVANTAYQFNNPGTAPCPATANEPCIVPYTATTTPFGTPTTTSGTLYGARQLQFGAKLNF